MKSDLLTSQILFDEAEKLGFQPQWETDYGLFSVKLSSSKNRQYFFHSSFNLNGELSRMLVKNKHFTRLILDKHNAHNIPYCLPKSAQQLRSFFVQNQPIICKPLLGQRSRGIKLVKTDEELSRYSLKMTFFEKFVQGDEYRYLILMDKVIAVQRKKLNPTSTNPWNLHYTGLKKADWDQKLVDEALRIAKVFYLNWVAVDYILDKQGVAWVLEVNSAPGIVKIHRPDAGVKTNAANLIWKELVKKPF